MTEILPLDALSAQRFETPAILPNDYINTALYAILTADDGPSEE